MSELPDPESQHPSDDEDRDWRFEFERSHRPTPRGDFPREGGWADAGEITDLGTGDNPPRSGE